MIKKLAILFSFIFLLSGCIGTTPDPANDSVGMQDLPRIKTDKSNTGVQSPTLTTNLPSNMKAILKTTKGDITINLFVDKSPKTVANFVGLSKGTQKWIDPATKQPVEGKSIYAGTVFHRVIDGFMIQGGDPLGTGTGGPGYRFADEFSDLKFDRPYLLAMANSGPNTNGSQFFITVAPTEWLTNKHTIFGEVVEGKEVVDAIATTQVGAQDRPVTPITINSIEILED